MNCYIVDDEQHNIDMTAQYVGQTAGLILMGSQTNPLLALQEIRAQKPDVVFTDIDMQEMDGITLAGLIDDISRVVFISGSFQSRFNGIDWKNYHYLRKPARYSSFLDIIENLRTEKNQ